MIDRVGMAEFLRLRREVLQPEDVGLPRGQRRRTPGLRRDEVAMLCHLSTDYYSRIERGRGPNPSEQMVASIAQGLHLTLDERDHLFQLAGHNPPLRGEGNDHVSPGMLRIFNRLSDTAAAIITELGETLMQTRLAIALTGDARELTGNRRSLAYRWFAEPATRSIHPAQDHELVSRFYAARLREVVGTRGPGSRAAQLADLLLRTSDEFRSIWGRHEIGVRFDEVARFVSPEVGVLELNCQTLLDPNQSHSLLVYTATPGSDSYEKLQLLSVIGDQRMIV